MAEIELGKPFGLDKKLIQKIDWSLAIKRILEDVKSDFIFAPHLRFIYRKAEKELVQQVTSSLEAGQYSPIVPITIEVPKTARIRVAVQSRRLGPNYSRPGSILLPHDRLLYQALADQAAPIIDAKTDKTRAFSHLLDSPSSANMFLPTRVCWTELQRALSKYSRPSEVQYILKIDVANFFGSLNQHVLINTLNDAGYPKGLSSRLEALLSSYSEGRSSRGILQGIFPSDLFGNYYLAPID